ncbi:RHS repeat-associated core domain-containing protein [Gymnodinialimonas sp.]
MAQEAIPTIDIPEFEAPDDVQSDGSFRYSIALDLPEFRGLVPSISASYNSSFRGRGAPDVWMGSGWRLGGFSSIERVTEGGGLASFDDARDIYRLDGTELLACSDAAATNPWPTGDTYGPRFRTNVESASCSAGGNLTPLIDDYRRIEHQTVSFGGISVPYFVVTNTRGIQYRYDSIGFLAQEATGTPNHDALFERVFLLSSIEDTQQTPNVVQIAYDFTPLSEGRAYRPSEITYAGYEVAFHYEELPEPMATYANGVQGFMGVVRHRLFAVTVEDTIAANGEIRAYEFSYDETPTIGAHLLSEIRQIGTDYSVVSASASVTGSALPSLLSNVVYQSDAPSFSEQTYTGLHFHSQVLDFDIDQDGRTELLFTGVLPNGLPGVGGDVGPNGVPETDAYLHLVADEPPLFTSQIAFNPSRNVVALTGVWSALLSGFGSDFDASQGCPSGTTRSLHGLTGYVPSEQSVFVAIREQTSTGIYSDGNCNVVQGTPTVEYSDLDGSTVEPLDDLIPRLQFSNVDSDPDPEAIALNVIAELSSLPNLADVTDDAGPNSFGPGVWAHQGSFPTNLHSIPSGGDGFGAASIVDLNGDGRSEFLFGPRAFWDGHQWCVYRFVGQTTVSCDYLTFDYTGGVVRQPGLDAHRHYSFGDFNGDGAQDLLMLSAHGDDPRQVHIAYGWGFGFDDRQLILDTPQLSQLTSDLQPGGDNGGSLLQLEHAEVVDLNADGLSDLILTASLDPSGPCPGPYYETTGPEDECTPVPNLAVVADQYAPVSYVFLSTGDGFIEVSDTAYPSLTGIVALGDFDGDGLDDVALRDRDGRIAWNDGAIPHLLTEFDTSGGGRIEVAYTPSTALENVGNNFPSVLQVVSAITRHDGRGQSRETTYSYVQGEYDYEYRRPLGFQTITAHLPAIAGETDGPMIVTTYRNDALRERGLVQSQTMIHGGQTWRQTINDWEVRADGDLPMRRTLSEERSRLLYGTELVETTTQFSDYTLFGNPILTIELGFTQNGTDLDTADNHSTHTMYTPPNLTAYIVDLPIEVSRLEGIGTNPLNPSQRLERHGYLYEGSVALNDVPSSTNLAVVYFQALNQAGQSNFRIETTLTYDVHGNVLTEADPLGNTSTFTYDTVRNLFRNSELNALGHQATGTWNTLCQAPATTTDVNGNTTSYTYDVFCREARIDHPNGHWEQTSWLNWGDPTAQFVERSALSAGTLNSNDTSVAREYVDGLGQVYRSSSSVRYEVGHHHAVVQREFDERGQLVWESIPRRWRTSSDANWVVLQNERNEFVHDPLGRMITTLMAGGGTATSEYTTADVSGVSYPSLIARDPHCFDGVSANLCGEVRLVSDARGNTIVREMTDVGSTDVGATGTLRTTEYDYDLRNRLVGVVDPIGASWTYTYDGFGNRTQASDPGLGTWTMSYDAADNLVLQTDALGQTIAFEYDDLNRITRRTVTGTQATYITTYTYDQPGTGEHNVGHLTQITNPDHTIRRGHDQAGNVTREEHTFLGRTYSLGATYTPAGPVLQRTLPLNPGSTIATAIGIHEYDSANNLRAIAGYLDFADYDYSGRLTQLRFDNLARYRLIYTGPDQFLRRVTVRGTTNQELHQLIYDRTLAGRVSRITSPYDVAYNHDYVYDYAGRLMSATPVNGNTGLTRAFSYDAGGSMVFNSAVGTYQYGPPTGPHPHAPTSVAGDALTYDANGNMTVGPPIAPGFNGRAITYDGENRPLTVNHGGAITEYTYAADGSRLLREDDQGRITATFGPVEIRNFGRPDEAVLTYVHPDIRVTNGASYDLLMRDQLGSVFAVMNEAGALIEERTYAPFGEITSQTGAASPEETYGFIGERYDADVGLQYLNARYYDPRLGIFIQPDWFEVTMPGVGTNRYSYSFNDPVNLRDPNGNFVDWIVAVNMAVVMDGELSPSAVMARHRQLTDGAAAILLPDVQELTNGEWTVNDAIEIVGLIPPLRAVRWGADGLSMMRRGATGTISSLPTSAQTQNLRTNMLRAGMRFNPSEEAHHIVAINSPRAARTRELLDEAGVDINSPANGVALPGTRNAPNPNGSTIHRGEDIHSDAYYRYIEDELGSVPANERAARLRTIADELVRGERNW